ncbi:MAG: thioredoxin family protein [Candidatus Nanohaloarchaea archaeon]
MREIQKYRYLVAGMLTLIMFSMGVLVSNFVDDARANSLRNQMEQDLTEIESKQLQLSYLKSEDVQSCKVLREGLNNIVTGYNQRLGNLQQYQKNSAIQAQRFETIKSRYILSGIRYWMFAEDIRKKCEYSPDTVLFFTNNLEKEGCRECEKMGRQLTLLKREQDSELLVFSIPVQIKDGMVDILESQYNVTGTPTVVVNGKHKLEGYHPRADIRKYLENGGTE